MPWPVRRRVSSLIALHPQVDPTRSVAIILFDYLVVLAIATAVVGVPFAANKVGTLVGFAILAAVAAWGRRLAIRGRQVIAMHGLAMLHGCFAIAVMVTSPRIAAPALILIMVLPAYAAVCGRRPAYALGAAYVAASVAVQWARSAGWSTPQLFPISRGAEILAVSLVMIGVIAPLSIAFARLREALRRADAEIERRATVEHELQAAQEAREAMLNALPDLMFKADHDGRIVEFHSAAHEQRYGLPSALLGKTFRDIFPEPVAHIIMKAMAQAAEQGTVRGTSYALSIDGETRWFELSIAAMATSPSTPHQVILLARDITDRRRAEREIEKLSTALAQSPESVIITNVDAQIEYVNQACMSASGYAWTELIGANPRIFKSGRTPAAVYDAMWTSLTRGEHWAGEFVSRRKDGSEYDEHAVVAPIRQSDGKITHYVAVKEDITEKKRMVDELAAHRGRLEELVATRTAELRNASRWLEATFSALESVGTAIFEAEVDSGRLTRVNPEVTRLLGYTQPELLSMRVSDIDPNMTSDVYPQIATQIRQKGWLRFETTQRRRDGTDVPVEMSVHYQPGTGDAQERFVGFGVNISDRKAAEMALREARTAAEAAAVAKANFLANMSHEIRTPMNAVIGLAHLIRKDGLSAEQDLRMGKLEAAAAHLLQIINSILDLSKIEAGKLVMQERPVRVETVIANTLAMLTDKAEEKGLHLTSDVDPLPLNLVGDPTWLTQALLNYANNAVKFTESGSVAIRVRLVEEERERVLVRFEVQDTGPGLDEADIPRLFSAFEQAERSTARQTEGTGLGLALTRRLAGLMGGEAGVRSTRGEGSTFWFTAWLKTSATAQSGVEVSHRGDPASAILAGFAGTRVLVAEDDAVSREILKAVLEDAGLSVDIAEDGVEAVAMARDGDYRLVLMDIMMPRMDGLEAAKVICKTRSSDRLPIIAMTANVFAEDQARCYEVGMDDCASKPLEPDKLYALLLDWLEKTAGPGASG